MARIRTIKPEIALHEGLFDLEQETGLPIRFVWAVLPCHCDREGRFEWRPRRLGTQILPYDGIDFSRVLHALATRGFIVAYRVGDEWYGCIPTFGKHQVINNRESDSDSPSIDDADEVWPEESNTSTREARDDDASPTREVHAQAEGNGTEGKGREQGERAQRAPQPPSKPSGSSGRGSRIPDDFELTDERLQYALDQGLDHNAARAEFAKFVDHWKAASGQQARKSDWDAAWRNWCRKAIEFAAQRRGKPTSSTERNASAKQQFLEGQPRVVGGD